MSKADIALVLALCAALALAFGNVIRQRSAQEITDKPLGHLALFRKLLGDPRWWLGSGAAIASYGLLAAALGLGSVMLVTALQVTALLEVTDPLGVAGGLFQLQISDGVGTCRPHDGPRDVEIGLAELGTIYMGAHRASELHRANRITELHSGAIHNLDAAFSTERAPYCGTFI